MASTSSSKRWPTSRLTGMMSSWWLTGLPSWRWPGPATLAPGSEGRVGREWSPLPHIFHYQINEIPKMIFCIFPMLSKSEVGLRNRTRQCPLGPTLTFKTHFVSLVSGVKSTCVRPLFASTESLNLSWFFVLVSVSYFELSASWACNICLWSERGPGPVDCMCLLGILSARLASEIQLYYTLQCKQQLCLLTGDTGWFGYYTTYYTRHQSSRECFLNEPHQSPWRSDLTWPQQEKTRQLFPLASPPGLAVRILPACLPCLSLSLA